MFSARTRTARSVEARTNHDATARPTTRLQSLKIFTTITLFFSFRLSYHEFLQRYSLALKHLNPVTHSHVTQSQAYSPKKTEASPRVAAVERLKRSSRRRHRSSYDHKRHICRSILEVVQVNSDDIKENLHTNDSGVKIGRTKVFLREEAVRSVNGNVRTIKFARF